MNLTNLAGFGPGTNIIFTYGGVLSGSLAVGNQPAGYRCTVLTDVAKQVRLAVAVSASPRFNNVQLSANGLLFGGNGGTANGSYYVLTSTNAALPVNAWKRAQTNQFDTLGAFIFTNAINPTVPQNFYRLQLP